MNFVLANENILDWREGKKKFQTEDASYRKSKLPNKKIAFWAKGMK